MPRNTREWAQRKFDMVIGNMETAKQHVDEVMATYNEQHPDLAEQMLLLQTTIEMLQKSTIQLKESF